MQPSRRRPPPPWERGGAAPRHPVGRTRRRFTDSPECAQRYRRAYDGAGDRSIDGERRVSEGLQVRRRQHGGLMQGLRRTPLRDGLVGLAIVGGAAPLAMSRLDALRTDRSHESIVPTVGNIVPLTNGAVGQAWRDATNEVEAKATEQVAAKSVERDAFIQQKIERYKDMGLDRKLAESIYDLALEEKIDPDIAFGLVRTESEFKATAQSHVGAVGLTQLMPATARWMRPGTQVADLRKPEVNLSIGFRYLSELIEKYDGDKELALLAYNRGPGTVDRVLKRGGNPDNGYAKAVFTGEGVHR